MVMRYYIKTVKTKNSKERITGSVSIIKIFLVYNETYDIFLVPGLKPGNFSINSRALHSIPRPRPI